MPWSLDSGIVRLDSGLFTLDGGGITPPPPPPPPPTPPPTPTPPVVIAPGAQPVGTLADLAHVWGGDLSTSSTGDLLLSTGLQRSQQRIFRRLNTNPNSYIGQPKYGAGLPQFIGKTTSPRQISAVVFSQMLLEDSVSKTPAPVVSAQQTPTLDAISLNIGYTDSPSAAPTVLAYTLS